MNHISMMNLRDEQKTPVRSVQLKTQRGQDERGRVTTLYKLDLASERFDEEFTRAFQLSVASARKENKSAPSRKKLANSVD